MTFLIFSSVIIFLLLTIISGEKNTYRAATVEYEPYTPQNTTDPMHLMLANAEKYAEYAAAAAQQNADIIVFPEHGILSILADKDNHHFVYTRDGLLPYFQTVPNPKTVSWNPCVNPSDYNNTEILFEISCSARNNSIAILANILSREECNIETDPNCPIDGRYQYNTNIVFDKNGTLIARYYKKHQLFLERILNSPKKV